MPVLLAIDEINALYATTEFTSPDHTLLEPGNLFLPRTLLEYISGQKKFVNKNFQFEYLFLFNCFSIDHVTLSL